MTELILSLIGLCFLAGIVSVNIWWAREQARRKLLLLTEQKRLADEDQMLEQTFSM